MRSHLEVWGASFSTLGERASRLGARKRTFSHRVERRASGNGSCLGRSGFFGFFPASAAEEPRVTMVWDERVAGSSGVNTNLSPSASKANRLDVIGVMVTSARSHEPSSMSFVCNATENVSTFRVTARGSGWLGTSMEPVTTIGPLVV